MSDFCVIWDWNGTLLDDTTAALNAFNRQLVNRGIDPISLAFYKDHFAFPVKPFYALCGIRLEDENWDALAREYHEAYAAEPKALHPEAIAALTALKSRGVRQFLLSALRQDLLDEAMDRYGLTDFFDSVVGVDNLDGSSKLARGRELVEIIGDCPRKVFIGDALHDAEVAAALGGECILTATGGHSLARLEKAARTVSSLLEAVDLV